MPRFGQLVRDMWPGAIAFIMHLLHEWGSHMPPIGTLIDGPWVH